MKILYVFIFGIGIRNIFKMNWRGPPKGPKSKSKSFIVHNNTHVHWPATQDTHTHAHAEEVAGEICPLLLTHPELSYLTGSQEQWAAFMAPATKPGATKPRSVLLFFCMFLCWGSLWRKPLWTRGEHANSTQKGPGDSPPEHQRPGPQ